MWFLYCRPGAGSPVLVTGFCLSRLSLTDPVQRYHVSLYPHSLELSLPLICELRDIVLHFIGGMKSLLFRSSILFLSTPSIRYNDVCGGNFSTYQRGAPDNVENGQRLRKYDPRNLSLYLLIAHFLCRKFKSLQRWCS